MSAELKKYAIVYTAFSRDGPGVALALTEDFHTFERYGVIMSPEDKDAASISSSYRRAVGLDPSAGQRAARAYVDLLFTRPAPLGQP